MRKGLSAVYGFVVIYLLIMAGLSAISNVANSQVAVQQSNDRARQLDSLRSSERLEVQYSNGTVSVRNDGSVLSTLEDLVTRASSGTVVAPLGVQLPVGGNVTLLAPASAEEVGVLTASGNLFWDDQGYKLVQALKVESVTPSADGIASGGPARTAVVVVAGPAQIANVSAGSLPPGVSVSFYPASVMVSPEGVKVAMTVAFSGTDYGTYGVEVAAEGADGHRANATYSLQTTPPDGDLVLAGDFLYPNGIGYPMEHKAAYWKGTYIASFDEDVRGAFFDAYVPLYYSGGWTAGEIGSLGTEPFSGYNLDFSQSSNQILKVADADSGANICYNIGTVGGSSVVWTYNGVGCEGPQVATDYTVLGYASGLIDSAGSWWGAVETADGTGDFHFEVLGATNGAWGEAYVSPSFGRGAQPVPELLQLKDGRVVTLYTTFSSSSSCSGDFLVATGDGGYSWSSPLGPFEAGGSPLCFDNSSGTSVGDTVYAGGVNSAGDLAFWSYDFDTASSSSKTLMAGIEGGAMGSAGSTLLMSYTLPGGCGTESSLHLMWSYDGGATWNDSGDLGCVRDYAILPSHFQTFQVLIETDEASAGGLIPAFFFYTV